MLRQPLRSSTSWQAVARFMESRHGNDWRSTEPASRDGPRLETQGENGAVGSASARRPLHPQCDLLPHLAFPLLRDRVPDVDLGHVDAP